MGFSEKTNINWRAGFRMDINQVLNDIETEYHNDLQSSFSCFDTAEEVSNETLSDMHVCRAKLSMLLQLGYINEDEFTEMCEYASEMRMDVLNINTEKDGE